MLSQGSRSELMTKLWETLKVKSHVRNAKAKADNVMTFNPCKKESKSDDKFTIVEHTWILIHNQLFFSHIQALSQNAELRTRLNRIHSESVLTEQVSVKIISTPDEVGHTVVTLSLPQPIKKKNSFRKAGIAVLKCQLGALFSFPVFVSCFIERCPRVLMVLWVSPGRWA